MQRGRIVIIVVGLLVAAASIVGIVIVVDMSNKAAAERADQSYMNSLLEWIGDYKAASNRLTGLLDRPDFESVQWKRETLEQALSLQTTSLDVIAATVPEKFRSLHFDVDLAARHFHEAAEYAASALNSKDFRALNSAKSELETAVELIDQVNERRQNFK